MGIKDKGSTRSEEHNKLCNILDISMLSETVEIQILKILQGRAPNKLRSIFLDPRRQEIFVIW